MSEHPTAIAITPDFAAVIADAMRQAGDRTTADQHRILARRLTVEARIAQGNARPGDEALIESLTFRYDAAEALRTVQDVARLAFEDIAGDRDPVQAARAWVDA